MIDRLLEQGSSLSIQLQPYNPPIQIPASGGSFDFNIAATNSSAIPQTFDVWCMVSLPNGSPYGPVLGPVNLTLPGNLTIDRDRTQGVPANAPSGDYSYNAYIGSYPNTILDSDSFTFTKLTIGSESTQYSEWRNTGDPFDERFDWQEVAAPVCYSLQQNHSNPFNPYTTIRFALPEAGRVQLTILNIMGQRVQQLVDGYRNAGYHEVTWDASNLVSGLYFYRIEANDFTSVKKMVLIK